MGIAAAVGVATGILLAPKSGKETREDLEKKAVNTVENIKYIVWVDLYIFFTAIILVLIRIIQGKKGL